MLNFELHLVNIIISFTFKENGTNFVYVAPYKFTFIMITQPPLYLHAKHLNKSLTQFLHLLPNVTGTFITFKFVSSPPT